MTTDLEVGLYGLRTFSVEELTGTLLPLNMPLGLSDRRDYFRTWAGGTCIAKCWFNPCHSPPEPNCTCGIYCIRELSNLRRQYSQANGLVAVVALEGQVIEGERGWRAQAARVVAMWAAPHVITPPLHKRINRQVPNLRWLSSPGELRNYPGVELNDSADSGQDPYDLRTSIVFASPSLAWGDSSEMRIALKILRSLLW